jgi:AcrR family transcriptional regulator
VAAASNVSNNQSPPAARRRLPVGRRREEIIAAALDLLSRNSPAEVSIDDVAVAAGASRALVYHYFGTKEKLYTAALRAAAAELTARLAPAVAGGGTPRRRLEAAVHGFVDYANAHAAGFVALLHGAPGYQSGDAAELMDTVRGAVLALLVDNLGISEPDATVRMTLRGWIAAAEASVLDWLEHHDIPSEEVERLLVEQLRAVLGVIGIRRAGSARKR